MVIIGMEKGVTQELKHIQPIADRASNEMSVTVLEDGRYIMIFQKDAIGTKYRAACWFIASWTFWAHCGCL